MIKPIEVKEPTLADQVFGLLAQIAGMWAISTVILYGMKHLNVLQSSSEN